MATTTTTSQGAPGSATAAADATVEDIRRLGNKAVHNGVQVAYLLGRLAGLLEAGEREISPAERAALAAEHDLLRQRIADADVSINGGAP